MPGRNVGRGSVVEPINTAQYPHVEFCEFIAFCERGGGEVRHVPVRHEVNLDRHRAAKGTNAGQWVPLRSIRSPCCSRSSRSPIRVGPYESRAASNRSVRGVTYGYA